MSDDFQHFWEFRFCMDLYWITVFSIRHFQLRDWFLDRESALDLHCTGRVELGLAGAGAAYGPVLAPALRLLRHGMIESPRGPVRFHFIQLFSRAACFEVLRLPMFWTTWGGFWSQKRMRRMLAPRFCFRSAILFLCIYLYICASHRVTTGVLTYRRWEVSLSV